MKKSTFLTLTAAAALLASASASFGAITYKDTGTTGLNVSTATNPDALDDVNFVAGTTAIRQELTGMTLGYGILPGTTAQIADIFVDFYGGLNTASTGAVNPTFLGGFGGTTNVAANTGTTTSFVATSFSGLNGLTTPINFTSDSIGVEIGFTDSTGMFYSTVITPLMTLSTRRPARACWASIVTPTATAPSRRQSSTPPWATCTSRSRRSPLPFPSLRPTPSLQSGHWRLARSSCAAAGAGWPLTAIRTILHFLLKADLQRSAFFAFRGRHRALTTRRGTRRLPPRHGPRRFRYSRRSRRTGICPASSIWASRGWTPTGGGGAGSPR